MYVNSIPFEESGWNKELEDGGIGCETMEVSHLIKGFVSIPILEDRECLNFLYGYILTRGVPATAGYPALPTTIVSEYIHTDDELNISKPWLTISGETPKYSKMSMRFGLSNPEQFALIEPALEQLQIDMLPFQNLSRSSIYQRGEVERTFQDEDYPISWAIQTGDPVIRFVAADSMQDEMQETLLLGLVFCMMTLWWGFRTEDTLKENIVKIKNNFKSYSIKSILASLFMGLIIYVLVGIESAIAIALITIILIIIWGIEAFGIAIMTTTPIFLVIIWLYGMIEVAGYGLNMVTVSIAAISLGVGIDYVCLLYTSDAADE